MELGGGTGPEHVDPHWWCGSYRQVVESVVVLRFIESIYSIVSYSLDRRSDRRPCTNDARDANSIDPASRLMQLPLEGGAVGSFHLLPAVHVVTPSVARSDDLGLGGDPRPEIARGLGENQTGNPTCMLPQGYVFVISLFSLGAVVGLMASFLVMRPAMLRARGTWLRNSLALMSGTADGQRIRQELTLDRVPAKVLLDTARFILIIIYIFGE